MEIDGSDNVTSSTVDVEMSSAVAVDKAHFVCLNNDCDSSGPFADEVPGFALGYYRKRRKRNQKICQRCFDVASSYFDKLNSNLKNRQSVFEIDPPPLSNKIILDTDEEESTSSSDEPISDDSKELLEEFVTQICDKYDIDFQIRKGKEKIEETLYMLEEGAQEMMEIMDNDMKIMNDWLKSNDEGKHESSVSTVDLTLENEVEPIIIEGGVLSDGDNNDDDDNDVVEIPVTDGESSTLPESMGVGRSVSSTDIEVVSVQRVRLPDNFPKRGVINRPQIYVGNGVFVMNRKRSFQWTRGIVLSVVRKCKRNECGITECGAYKVKINGKPLDDVPFEGRHLAYTTLLDVLLEIGERVIGSTRYDDSSQVAFYSGTIAEPPSAMNLFRYLIFFDSGFSRYVYPSDIRLICEPSRNPWKDVPHNDREFLEKYLNTYPDRPMVKLQINDVIKVKNGDLWWKASVKRIDVSIVEIKFNNINKKEWIYRGSPRLSQIYSSMLDKSKGRIRRRTTHFEKHSPYIEYTHEESVGTDIGDESQSRSDDVVIVYENIEDSSAATKPPRRDTARKSTASRNNVRKSNSNTPNTPLVAGKLIEIIQGSKNIKPAKYVKHDCSKQCLLWTLPYVKNVKNASQISKPLYHGFQRLLLSHRNFDNGSVNVYSVLYRAPCGRTLRLIKDAHEYLKLTESELTIDCFDYDHWIRCLTEYVVEPHFIKISDISNGLERNPIQCVNQYDNTMPNFCGYMTKRKPRLNVALNTDKEFLCGCDCTDDCKDKRKCACCRLTVEGQNLIPGNPKDPHAGYRYRRLADPVITGVYECNDQCKCSRQTCLNRVVQYPISQKLQLFKTKKKGWGIRSLNDIPRGSFICVYVGHLLTDQTANEEGKHFGDEYYADLDFIEVVEQYKSGYESSVTDLSEDDSEDYDLPSELRNTIKGSSTESDSSSEEIHIRLSVDSEDSTRYRFRDRNTLKKKSKKNGRSNNHVSSSSEEESTSNADKNSNEEGSNKLSTRAFYGPNERVYIMDARTSGNIGRYLNHSCDPNVFVQNVFVDTHDLRFPWITFFAKKYIEAGTELTWDYNYEVGCVDGKVLYCHCGSNNCRGRLL